MPNQPHFAELLLSLKLHGKRDPLHTGSRGHFSTEIDEANAILHNPTKSKVEKRAAYKRWLTQYQPCMFGKTAARNDKVFLCLLEEHEILGMRSGDADLRQTIIDHQLVWRRYALHGLSSSFVIVVCSEAISQVAPSPELKELCRRLMEIYLNCTVHDDEILQHEEWAYLAKGKGANLSLLKFATLPNIFCAQADRRWWHDHRTPGALMITSNALGHFMHSLGDTVLDLNKALRMAMGTIQNACPVKGKGTATALLPRPDQEPSPLFNDEKFGSYSAINYSGKFHTDHLIPSIFFESGAPNLQYNDLDFSYIHERQNIEHPELMSGLSVDWHTVENAIWLGVNERGDELKRKMLFEGKAQGAAKSWLTRRVKERCR